LRKNYHFVWLPECTNQIHISIRKNADVENWSIFTTSNVDDRKKHIVYTIIHLFKYQNIIVIIINVIIVRKYRLIMDPPKKNIGVC